MNPLLKIFIVFGLIAGGGYFFHGMLGMIFMVASVVWLVYALVKHGRRSGWYIDGPIA